MSEVPDGLIGQTVAGRYVVERKIGEGGMGAVWRAVDTTLDREVAITVLPESFATDPERLARFEREARSVASLVWRVNDSDVLVFVSVWLCFNGERRRVHTGRQVSQRDRTCHGGIQDGAAIRDRTEVRRKRPVVTRQRVRIEENATLDQRLIVVRQRVVTSRPLYDEGDE